MWSVNKGVDLKTLQLCFDAFNLELTRDDYSFLAEDTQHANPSAKPDRAIGISEDGWFYPDRPLPVDCPLYIERPPIEESVYREIVKPGAVIRIRSARQMGKTSLILRLLAFAKNRGYRTVKINCHQINPECFGNLDLFLRCLCYQIATQLQLEPNLDNIWDEEIGCKLNCSLYLQKYLLQQSENPLVLVLSEVDLIFDYPQIADEFFSLLRSWCDEAGHDSIWQKLRLVIVYGTDRYISLNINHSPFNLGLPIYLAEFTPAQVEELATRYGLNWTPGKESAQLMSLVGGHPALVQIALFYLASGHITVEKLIEDAIASGGIYRSYLWEQWLKLKDNPRLLNLYTELVTNKRSVEIDPVDAYQLESLGLICIKCDRLCPRGELYRNYFANHLYANPTADT